MPSEEQEKTENYVCERGFLQRNESAHVRVITIENSLTHRCLNATGNASPGPAGKRRVPNAFALARKSNKLSDNVSSFRVHGTTGLEHHGGKIIPRTNKASVITGVLLMHSI